MEVVGQLVDRAALEQFLELLLARLEALARHSLGRPDGVDGIRGERQIEWAILGAEEAAGGKRFQLLRFADTFEPLADVDERRNGRIVRPTNAANPGAEMRAGD